MARLNQDYKDRGKHKNRTEAFFALVGYTIGLGNLWRFSYRLGLYGVTFLIPYGVFLVFVGVPLYILELALGQYISLGPIHVFTFMCPLLKGLGWAMLLSLVLVVVYYNVILAWAVYYIVAAFGPSSRLPWSLCTHNNNRNTTGCGLRDYTPKELYDSAKIFFRDEVMGGAKFQGETDGAVGGVGVEYYDINWTMVGYLGVAWLLVTLCVVGGLRTRGKVLYITVIYPYVMLIFLFFFNIQYTPEKKQDFLHVLKNSFNLTQLAEENIWKDAAGQVFYSLGTGFGVITAISSYNPLTHNIIRDGFLVCLLDTITSFLCGYVFFVLQSAYTDDYTTFEPDTSLVFTSSSVILANLESPLWAIHFFTMIFALGFNSQLVMVEAVTTSLFDQFTCLQHFPKAVVALACGFMFLLGVPICARGQLGIDLFEFLDSYTSSHSLIIIAGLQVVLVTYCYGFKKMINGMRKEMKLWIPTPIYAYLYVTWHWLVPISVLVLLAVSLMGGYHNVALLFSTSTDHNGTLEGRGITANFFFNGAIWGQIIAFSPTVLLILLILHSCFKGQNLKQTKNFCPEYQRQAPRRDPHLPNVWFEVDSESMNYTVPIPMSSLSTYQH
ncbi:hypothetical protein Pmani_003980 [Petrolisthes manimaculis]|uniref:Sodium-dependent nutrient amino acid transporter 1 n=1 Tax=Petrolisthes manimaculis TaxID=1843537 RepID=A0AAE1QHH6_9EUCA|nr:hypothetical protein Pmani_003980 [Petrolisthes manimaculis]